MEIHQDQVTFWGWTMFVVGIFLLVVAAGSNIFWQGFWQGPGAAIALIFGFLGYGASYCGWLMTRSEPRVPSGEFYGDC